MLVWLVCGSFAASADIDFAPLFSIDRDVSGAGRIRALGPLFEFTSAADDKEMWAVRPLTSFESFGVNHKTQRNVLWPVWMGESFQDEYQWYIMFLINWLNYDINDPASRYRFWMLPFYIQGRDAHGENYLAVFPVGGKVNEFLGRDKIWFVLFPLALYSSVNDVETRSYLWPVFSRTTGRGNDRFRVFPVYGYARLRQDYMKKFIMWPIWTAAEYRYAGSSGFAYVFFPFYGRVHLENQDSWMVVPPFFRFAKGDKGGMIHCPWPFFQRRWGETNLFYIWPLFGRKQFEYITRYFFLWPITSLTVRKHENTEHTRFLLMPFITSQSKTVKNAGKPDAETVEKRFFKFWPLISYDRAGDSLEVRVPNLWPFKDFRAITRNYAPLWTLYSRDRQNGVTEDELLWGLFKYRRGKDAGVKISLFPFISVEKNTITDSSEWSVLKGLFGCKRLADKRRFRFLYFFSFGRLRK